MKNIRIVILIGFVVLLSIAVIRSRRNDNTLFAITQQDLYDMKNTAINDYDDIGQRDVLLQGDALDYQRQQEGINSRTFDFDPMDSKYGKAGGFDKITDTSAYFREAGGVPSRRNASLKEFNSQTGLWENKIPLSEMNLKGGLPGFDTLPLGMLAELKEY